MQEQQKQQNIMNVPNVLSIVRMILVPVFMASILYMGDIKIWGYVVPALIFALTSFTDMLDGKIARKYGLITDFGKFVDPLADKMLVITAMLLFVEQGRMPAWILALVITREFAVSGLRLIAVGKGNVIAAAWSGKIKTACTMVGLGTMMVFTDVIAVDWVVTGLIVLTTVYSGVEYFIHNRKCLLS